jgi:hypothetical protein
LGHQDKSNSTPGQKKLKGALAMNNWLMTEKYAQTRHSELLAEAQQAYLARTAPGTRHFSAWRVLAGLGGAVLLALLRLLA